jgi:hypothetical protein
MLKLLKKQKGQIIILDVLFATVLIIFLFLILSKTAEIRIYERISDGRVEELEQVGYTVYNKLVNNPLINCYVAYEENTFLVRSCFPNNFSVTKEDLGVPSGYKCSLNINYVTINQNGCNDNDSGVDNYFMLEHDVLVSNNRQITKSDHISGTAYNNKKMTIKVWRDE